MYWKDVGYLCIELQSLDNKYRPKYSYEEKLVYCNVKSIGQSEFYQAQVAGLKPELKIEVIEYNNETHFRYNKKLYKILRTYQRGDIWELTLVSLVVDNE